MKCCCLGQKASEEPNSPASTDDLARGTMKSVQEQHIVSAEKDLQFQFTPNTEDAVGTCTYDLAGGTMKSVQEQHIVSAEKDLQFQFTPNTEDAVGTCTYDLASGTMKSVQEQYIASAATTTTTKTRKERFYIARTEEGITIEESFIE